LHANWQLADLSTRIDDELARLTKDLELSPALQPQVWALLQQHHGRIQALFDENPSASRQALGPQIHAISAQTHAEIHALLTAYQTRLEAAIRQRLNDESESRRAE
jgi:hypothetical protein